MTSGPPLVAVAPQDSRDWIRHAVVDGGGRLVDLPDAQALVWTAARDPDGLREAVAAAPQLRWVQLPWAGVEPFAAAGVFDGRRTWTSGKGVYAQPVAEHALALALAGLREIKRFATAGTWTDQAGISLVGGRVTVFGGGGIARELLGLLRPFGCRVTVVRRHPGDMHGADRVLSFEERYEALRGADAIVLALALTPETRGLMTDIEFELMEPHAWLVNVARGEHVATGDLVNALREDVIGGAALDVTDPEPLPDGHPLWSLPNCLITPHTANTDDMAQPLLSRRIAENVARFAEGRELVGPVDPRLGY
ncbi:MAG: D-isomer specific 2-hydroxyacid dehydrogenase family protein [Actinobacteria bacterium]|nr:D-isomer specific 2-hydroxyacid dehydrogenase family protein [Actinomycetota bacterium]